MKELMKSSSQRPFGSMKSSAHLSNILICVDLFLKIFSFLQHRFNPPIPSENVSDGGSDASRAASAHNSTVESFPDSFEAMLEIQT